MLLASMPDLLHVSIAAHARSWTRTTRDRFQSIKVFVAVTVEAVEVSIALAVAAILGQSPFPRFETDPTAFLVLLLLPFYPFRSS